MKYYQEFCKVILSLNVSEINALRDLIIKNHGKDSQLLGKFDMYMKRLLTDPDILEESN